MDSGSGGVDNVDGREFTLYLLGNTVCRYRFYEIPISICKLLVFRISMELVTKRSSC